MKKLTVRNLLLSLAVVATLLPSCKKDEEYSLILDERIALIEEPGGQVSIGYTAYGLASVSATTIPQGWTITVNTDERRIYITAPTLFGDESVTTTEEGEETEPNVKYGTAIITGRTSGNSSVSSSLYVSVADQVDFSDEPSNSYILTKSNTRYCIDATQKGENGGTISPASVAILWQTPYKLLEYPRLADGKAYVFFTTGEDDDDNPVFNSGNAVLGAFDAAGELLWTWHLWCTENDPRNETVELGGETAMKRNLGALTISGTSEEDILDSYGLYYQWGRKDPFPGPAYYNMAESAEIDVYDSENNRAYISYIAASAETGTQEYAGTHTKYFISGVEESRYNWLYTADPTLWGTAKTLNDPCPKGWKVAPKSFYAALQIKDDITPELEKNYGFTLTDGVNEAFFPGAGRRSFYTGALTNMNENEERPTPWIGYYWSSSAEGTSAYAMDFSFDINGTRTGSSFHGAALQYAAGGMQVRCVKE